MARTKQVKRNRDWYIATWNVRSLFQPGASRVMDGRPGGRRSKGRPHSRWFDGVENNLRKMGVRGWRRSAENRRDIC